MSYFLNFIPLILAKGIHYPTRFVGRETMEIRNEAIQRRIISQQARDPL
ncbi:hypothetical protein EDC52_105188 [Biostraticola tofi]|uniref:Uncharacterized protein n=1 Tax=Biostraticola tofi TaxID=466109 RepID=A0A4R3YRI9_9GAMM|nr:hypothetical protein EDC52_105188 [Biostraticola tofi]